MTDYAYPLKKSLLAGEPRDLRLHEAKKWLGARYVLHPANRVQRLETPLADVFIWKPRVLKGARP